MVGDALQLHLQSEQAPDGSQPFYLQAFPKERLQTVDAPFDGITYRVLSCMPSEVRNDGTTRRTPIEFTVPDPNKSGYELVTTTYLELLTAEFTIWSKSNATRSALTTWFHRFMLRYANSVKYFEARGADKFQPVGRGEDGFETREQQEIYYSTLTYQVRLQFLDQFSKRQIDHLTVEFQFGKDQQTILQTA